jgi:histidine triad (HIT) family protein
MQACIFCKIVAGEIPATVIERDDDVIVITDVNPQAPTHLLVMPVQHFANLNAFAEGANDIVVAHLFAVAARLGASAGKESADSPGGYRLVVNTGANGGQTVAHLHVHVLAGRHMTWPPG